MNNCRYPTNCKTSNTNRAVRASRPCRLVRSRLDPTYQLCKLQAVKPGDPNQYNTEDECKAATYCNGPNKAYSYVCGATATDPPQQIAGGTGQASAATTNCYDCGAAGTCDFAPNGAGNALFNTKSLCDADPGKMCGWKYGCNA